MRHRPQISNVGGAWRCACDLGDISRMNEPFFGRIGRILESCKSRAEPRGPRYGCRGCPLTSPGCAQLMLHLALGPWQVPGSFGAGFGHAYSLPGEIRTARIFSAQPPGPPRAAPRGPRTMPGSPCAPPAPSGGVGHPPPPCMGLGQCLTPISEAHNTSRAAHHASGHQVPSVWVCHVGPV